MAKQQMLICPYCGEAQTLSDRCRACRGLFEPLSRQATHNSMGPWYIRDPKRPHRPGCSYETLVRLIERNQIDRFSIIRGPTTRQFWAVAKRVPGVAHLLGYCHNCDAHVEPTHHGCPKCGVSFGAYINRNHLGLPDIRPMPWEAELDLTDRSSAVAGGQGLAPSGNGNKAAAAPGGLNAPVRRNVGISSFATDEELTGPPPEAKSGIGSVNDGTRRADIPRQVIRAGASSISAPSDEPEFVDVPGEEPGLRDAPLPAESPGAGSVVAGTRRDGENDRVARALRTAVQKQQRTIRFLMIALLATIVLSIAINVILARSQRDTTTDHAGEVSPSTNEQSASLTGSNSATAEQRVPSHALPGVSTDDSGVSVSDNGPGLEVPDARSAQPVNHRAESGEAALDARLSEATALLEAAADSQRTLDDRIADCEKAVGLLKALHQLESGKPAGVEELLQRAENELERLRLTQFFP